MKTDAETGLKLLVIDDESQNLELIESALEQQGLEILLQLKNGDRRQVVQGIGPDAFAAGDPVILVTTGGRTRVMRAPPVTTGSTAPNAYPAAYPAPAQQ